MSLFDPQAVPCPDCYGMGERYGGTMTCPRCGGNGWTYPVENKDSERELADLKDRIEEIADASEALAASALTSNGRFYNTQFAQVLRSLLVPETARAAPERPGGWYQETIVRFIEALESQDPDRQFSRRQAAVALRTVLLLDPPESPDLPCDLAEIIQFPDRRDG